MKTQQEFNTINNVYSTYTRTYKGSGKSTKLFISKHNQTNGTLSATCANGEHFFKLLHILTNPLHYYKARRFHEIKENMSVLKTT